jgi:tetratricopeptide (TPR) repeat protein
MILRLSDSLGRGLVVVVGVLLALWLSLSVIRTAVAAYGTDGNREEPLQRAVKLEPGNPIYWYLLGRQQEYNLEQSNSALAETSYKKAIALDPFYTDAWLDLATAYELDDNIDQAGRAYLQAKKSYPVSAEVSWRYGNFLLRRGDQVRAYTQLRQAIEADPHRAATAFSRAYQVNPNIDQILQQLLPARQSVYLDVITEASSEKQLAVALTVWNRLFSLHPRLAIGDVSRFVSTLLNAGEYAPARRVWDQGVGTMHLPTLFHQENSVVWDPSFESNFNGEPFSWNFQPLAQGVSVGLDRSEKVSGFQSLRLSFDGKHNPNLAAACAPVVVEPKTTYHFSAWIKTESITTENGVGFRVSSLDDPKAAVLSTNDSHGTLPWTMVEGIWTSSFNTHRAVVCVVRNPSDNAEVRISGMAWVDDINLRSLPPERSKP